MTNKSKCTLSLFSFLIPLVIILPTVVFSQTTSNDIQIAGGGIFSVAITNLPTQDACGPSQANLCIEPDGRCFSPDGPLLKEIGSTQYQYSGVHLVRAGQAGKFNFQLVNKEAAFVSSWELKLDGAAKDFSFTNNSIPSTPNFDLEFRYDFPEPVLDQNDQPEIQLATFIIQTSYLDKTGNGQQKLVEITIPFIVTGAVGPVIPYGSTITPKIPYLVLHDPPGDGSFSSFSRSFETCRSFATSYLLGGGAKVWGQAKLGFETSGIIPVETYVSVTAGLSIDVQTNTQNETQMCISTTKEFVTSDLDNNVGSASDIFIGSGLNLDYGLAKSVVYDYNDCTAKLQKTIAFKAKGSYSDFVLTEKGIRDDMEIQNNIVNNPNVPESEKSIARAQIKAWENVLAINDKNKADALAQPGGKTISFSSESEQTETKAITTSVTNYIESTISIAAELAIEVGAEFAGSGASAGVEVNIRSEFGESTTNSETKTEEASFTLKDDDDGDNFNVIVKTDPMYGTPLFQLKDDSRTSCPYEGGYRLDQPNLQATLSCKTGDNLVLSNIPANQNAIIPLNICNNSNFDRTYYLSLDGSSNVNGAVLSVAGTELNATDIGTPFTVKANSCFSNNGEVPLLVLAKAPGTNILNYDNINVFLRPGCEQNAIGEAAIFDAIKISARFSNDPNAITSVTIDNAPADLVAPVITNCQQDISVTIAAGACSQIVNYVMPTATDNCSLASIRRIEGPGSGENFFPGTTTVRHRITDSAGNFTDCVFLVTVVDNEAPKFSSVPSDQTVRVFPGACGEIVQYATPMVSDNCGVVSFERTAGPASGENFFPGETVVSYTASDAAGNQSSVSFTVTVIDDEAPVFSSVPPDRTVSVFPGACGERINYDTPALSDNCGVVSFERTEGPASGENFFPGETTVTYTAIDAAGNVATASFTVTVIDDEPPALTNCPNDIQVIADPGTCGTTVNYSMPQAFDNCFAGEPVLAEGFASGQVFPIGTTKVSHVFTDNSGNTTRCSFNVVVTDQEAPQITGCVDSIVVTAVMDQCSASVDWPAPQAQDNCSVVTSTSSHQAGSTFEVGRDTVTYSFSDDAGNISTCSFPVIVLPAEENSCDMVVSSSDHRLLPQLAFDVFPNPAHEIININFTHGQTEQMQVDLFDLSGRLLQRLRQQTGIGEQFISLPVNDLANGTYMVRLQLQDASGKIKTGIQKVVVTQ